MVIINDVWARSAQSFAVVFSLMAYKAYTVCRALGDIKINENTKLIRHEANYTSKIL